MRSSRGSPNIPRKQPVPISPRRKALLGNLRGRRQIARCCSTRILRPAKQSWEGRRAGGRGGAPDRRAGPLRKPSEGDVSVLAREILLALAFEHLQGTDELLPRVLGTDDLIDVAELGGFEGVRELLAVLADQTGT